MYTKEKTKKWSPIFTGEKKKKPTHKNTITKSNYEIHRTEDLLLAFQGPVRFC